MLCYHAYAQIQKCKYLWTRGESRNNDERICDGLDALDDSAVHSKLTAKELTVRSDRATNIYSLLRAMGSHHHSDDPSEAMFV